MEGRNALGRRPRSATLASRGRVVALVGIMAVALAVWVDRAAAQCSGCAEACTCGGLNLNEGEYCCLEADDPYDPQEECCTPDGIQPKHPIADLESCPERVPHPGYTPSANGCGAEGGVHLPNVGLAPGFEACCAAHDICYGTCNSDKAQCDQAFLGCMLAQCLGYRDPVTTGACVPGAVELFAAVTAAGQTPWEEAQKEACDCCPTPPPFEHECRYY